MRAGACACVHACDAYAHARYNKNVVYGIAELTFFVYVCNHNNKVSVMKDNLNACDIIYVNRLTNVVYKDGDILETTIKTVTKDSRRDTIFDLFARVLVKNVEQRKALYHIMFDKEEYTRNKLCKKLSLLYNKSDKTYQRALDYLFGRRIIYQDRYKILHTPIEYDLALLDLDNIKSIMIHID